MLPLKKDKRFSLIISRISIEKEDVYVGVGSKFAFILFHYLYSSVIATDVITVQDLSFDRPLYFIKSENKTNNRFLCTQQFFLGGGNNLEYFQYEVIFGFSISLYIRLYKCTQKEFSTHFLLNEFKRKS